VRYIITMAFFRALGIIMVSHSLNLDNLHWLLFIVGCAFITGTLDDGGIK
jgi:hypothetical protein